MEQMHSLLLQAYLAAILSFVIVYAALDVLFAQRGEKAMVSRCVVWTTCTVVALFATYVMQLYFDLVSGAPVAAPLFGPLRPIFGAVFCLLGSFIHTHPCFRYLTCTWFSVMIVADSYSQSLHTLDLECGPSSCNPVLSWSDISLARGKDLVAVFFDSELHGAEGG